MSSEREELVIWGAVGPNGQLVKSSVGTFKSVAARWALRRGNYEVVKLGVLPSPGPEEDEKPTRKSRKEPVVSKASEPVEREEERPVPPKRPRGRPRKVVQEAAMEMAHAELPQQAKPERPSPERYRIDRSFFGRQKKRK